MASGITDIVLVTGRGKNAIEDHFDVSTELEAFLAAKGKHEMLEEVKKVSSLIDLSYVRQGEPLGLGHAVLVTKNLVGDEPFAVVLGDDIFDATPPALRQMLTVFEQVHSPVIAVERVPQAEVSSYGILKVEPAPEIGPGVHRILDMVEKPPAAEAPSNLAIIGRYLLTPDIFPALEATASDRTGEIQLTNGLKRLLATPQALCAGSRRRAPRRRQQDGLPEGDGLLRVAPAGSGRAVPPLSRRRRASRSRAAPSELPPRRAEALPC